MSSQGTTAQGVVLVLAGVALIGWLFVGNYGRELTYRVIPGGRS